MITHQLINGALFGAGPTPTFVSSGTLQNSGTASATYTATYPASGLQADDIALVFLLGVENVGSAPTWTMSAPSGWNTITGPLDPGLYSIISARSYAFWKRLTGSESGTQNFTSSSSTTRFRFTGMSVFRGCVASGTPYEGLNTNHSAAGTADLDPRGASITTTGANRLGVTYIGVTDNTAGATPPGDWTSRYDSNNATSNLHNVLSTKELVSAGTEAAQNPSNLGSTESWCSVALALLPNPA